MIHCSYIRAGSELLGYYSTTGKQSSNWKRKQVALSGGNWIPIWRRKYLTKCPMPLSELWSLWVQKNYNFDEEKNLQMWLWNHFRWPDSLYRVGEGNWGLRVCKSIEQRLGMLVFSISQWHGIGFLSDVHHTNTEENHTAPWWSHLFHLYSDQGLDYLLYHFSTFGQKYS